MMREHKYRARLKIKLGELPIGSWVYFCLQDAHFNDIIDWETCCDWTGLFDKNGTEIYEGDIVHLEGHKHNHKIIYTVGSFVGKQTKGKFQGYLDGLFFYRTEVIGNIYSNPELLK